MKLVFAPDQARPVGTEDLPEDELKLELYTDLSPLPSLHSDDDKLTLSGLSLAWDDDDRIARAVLEDPLHLPSRMH